MGAPRSRFRREHTCYRITQKDASGVSRGRSPLVDFDPAELLQTEPAVDRIAHRRRAQHPNPPADAPGLTQRREGDRRPYTTAPRPLHGRDEVDDCDPRPE